MMYYDRGLYCGPSLGCSCKGVQWSGGGKVVRKLNDFSCLLFSVAEAAKDADCDI